MMQDQEELSHYHNINIEKQRNAVCGKYRSKILHVNKSLPTFYIVLDIK